MMVLHQRISIHFVHSSPTPHNNYLLDELGKHPEVDLHLHYIRKGDNVPGRPWKTLDASHVSARSVRTGVSRFIDFKLMRLAFLENSSVFFIIGWDYLSLVLLIVIVGLLRRPLLMWDDGPTPDAVTTIKKLKLKNFAKRILIGLINRTPGSIFVTGDRAAKGLIEMSFNKKKICLMPFFCRRGTINKLLLKRLGIQDGTKVILAAGRIIYSKGFDIYVEAIARLKAKYPDGWSSILLGSGPDLEEIKRRAKTYNLEKKIRFVEWAEPNEYLSYIELCDIFVAPARFDHYPTTIISAMQAGKSVVVTDNVGWADELVKNGISGITVPVEDVDSLMASLLLLIQDSNLQSRLGKEGQKAINEWPVTRGVELIVRAAKESLGLCAES